MCILTGWSSLTYTLASNTSIEFLQKQVTALQRHNIALQARLDEQNIALREQNIALHASLDEQNIAFREQNITLQASLDERDRVILELRANPTTFQDLLFGKSSEQAKKEKPTSDSKDKGENQGTGKEGKPKGNRGGYRKRRKHVNLPLVETTLDLSEDKKKCSCCGLAFQFLNDIEEGETVEIEVKGYRKKIRRRSYARKCKCSGGGAKIITAESPGKLLSKGSIGTSVWIKMLLDKFLFYIPTYRALDQMQLEGIDLAQSTINDGMFKIKTLLTPIYDAICEKNRQEDRWNADETGWPGSGES